MPILKPPDIRLRTDQAWCQWCGRIWSICGYKRHVRTCEQDYRILRKTPKKKQVWIPGPKSSITLHYPMTDKNDADLPLLNQDSEMNGMYGLVHDKIHS